MYLLICWCTCYNHHHRWKKWRETTRVVIEKETSIARGVWREDKEEGVVDDEVDEVDDDDDEVVDEMVMMMWWR